MVVEKGTFITVNCETLSSLAKLTGASCKIGLALIAQPGIYRNGWTGSMNKLFKLVDMAWSASCATTALDELRETGLFEIEDIGNKYSRYLITLKETPNEDKDVMRIRCYLQ